MYAPKVSIIIPTKELSKNLLECINHCNALNYSSYEIIVLPDDKILSEDIPDNVLVIPTGSKPPSIKRDIAIPHTKGEILAFIDDDAYPREDWLTNAVVHFQDNNVAAIGGPAVTPDQDNIRQKAGGHVLSSSLGSGSNSYRYTPKKMREVDDYPTCNLFVRKTVMEKLGGFDTKYWPGEDTKLCLEITKRLKMTILYVPNVVVYHHRRELFKPHLKQIWNYAIHRGYFVKKFPETSFRISYFIPSLLVVGFVIGIPLIIANYVLRISLTIVGYNLSLIFALLIAFYLVMTLITAVKTKNWKISVFVIIGIVLTHTYYGIGFIRGLLARRLKH